MPIKKLTVQEAIEQLKVVLKTGNRQEILNVFTNTLPDWDEESNYVWEDWDNMCDKVMKKLGYF